MPLVTEVRSIELEKIETLIDNLSEIQEEVSRLKGAYVRAEERDVLKHCLGLTKSILIKIIDREDY